MSVFAVMLVKDEIDIINHVLDYTMTQVDEIIVLDNGSTDGTRDILSEYPIAVFDDLEVKYKFSQRMSWLASKAGEHGASWIIPIDADEIWYSPDNETIKEKIKEIDQDIIVGFVYDHIPTALDDDNPNPFLRMKWRQKEHSPLRDVACRYLPNLRLADGNHTVSFENYNPSFSTSTLAVRHFPIRSPEQFLKKTIIGRDAIAATPELPLNESEHWRHRIKTLNESGEEGLFRLYYDMYWSGDPIHDANLVSDPAPI